MKIKIKLLALFLSLSVLFNFSIITSAVGQKQSCNYGNLNFSVEYTTSAATVTEKITISETGHSPILLEKVISEDGTVEVYQNGVKVNTLQGASYELYIAAAQNKVLFNNSKEITTYANYPCGYDEEHMYVTSSEYTVNIAANNTVSSIVSSIIGGCLHPVVGATLGIITAIAQYAVDSGADYIDISETKYFVHGAYVNDMNCYHSLYTYYNKTASGGTSVIRNEWVYTQELI